MPLKYAHDVIYKSVQQLEHFDTVIAERTASERQLAAMQMNTRKECCVVYLERKERTREVGEREKEWEGGRRK